MYELLAALLVDEMQCNADDVSPDARVAAVGLDSLAAVELSALLHQRVGVKVADHELLDAATLGHIAELMTLRATADEALS